MSDDANKAYILKFSGQDATGPAFDEIIARAKEAGAKISTQLNNGMGGGGKPEWLEGLKNQFGRESGIGGIGELLRGGGAVVGITAATEAIKGLAEGFEQIKKDSQDTDKNWADMAQDLMKSVPVLGSIEEAGAAINELFTGEQEALQKATEDAASLDKELTIHKQLIKEGSEYYHDIEETIKRIAAHTAEIGLPAFQKQQAETQQSGTDKKDALDKSTDAQIKKLQQDASPALDELRTKIAAEQEKLANGITKTSMDLATGMPMVSEDTDAEAESRNHLAQLEARKRLIEKNRDHQINLAKSGNKSEHSTIDADTNKQLQHDQAEHDRQMREDARQSAIEHQASIAEQGAAEMQLRGHFLNANIAQIHAAAEKEAAELRLSADKKEDDLKKGSKEWLAIEADVAQKSADIQQQASDKEAEARCKDQEYEREQILHHAQEIIDTQAETRDKALRSVGKTFEADREQLERQHNDRIAKIKADAQAEIDVHGEHKDEIKKRAQESINAENQSYAVGSLAQKIEAEKSMGPVDMTASAVGGVGLDANALGAMASPVYMKEQAASAHGKQVKALQDQMAAIAPSAGSQDQTIKINDAGIVGAIERVLAKIAEGKTFRINFTP